MTMERITKRLVPVCGESPRDCTELITEGPLGRAVPVGGKQLRKQRIQRNALSLFLCCLFTILNIWERIMKLFPCALQTHTQHHLVGVIDGSG